MFSTSEKQHIAAEIEKLLLSLNHPEMPKEKPGFFLHVDGAENWSWANIIPNWRFNETPEVFIPSMYDEVSDSHQ